MKAKPFSNPVMRAIDRGETVLPCYVIFDNCWGDLLLKDVRKRLEATCMRKAHYAEQLFYVSADHFRQPHDTSETLQGLDMNFRKLLEDVDSANAAKSMDELKKKMPIRTAEPLPESAMMMLSMWKDLSQTYRRNGVVFVHTSMIEEFGCLYSSYIYEIKDKVISLPDIFDILRRAGDFALWGDFNEQMILSFHYGDKIYLVSCSAEGRVFSDCVLTESAVRVGYYFNCEQHPRGQNLDDPVVCTLVALMLTSAALSMEADVYAERKDPKMTVYSDFTTRYVNDLSYPILFLFE